MQTADNASSMMADGMRAEFLFEHDLGPLHVRSDAVFVWLLPAQWAASIAIALVLSPYSWQGKIHTTHLHVYYAVIVGGLITVPSALLAWKRAGWVVTRCATTVSQMLWSALLIHLTGGRIETHFHIFASLGFVAYYRSWRLLLLASVLTLGDHVIRAYVWPESLYGINNPPWWRTLEHGWWMLFEDFVLGTAIIYELQEMRVLPMRHVQLENFNERVEDKVRLRTHELNVVNDEYRSLLENTRAVPWRWNRSQQRFSYVGPQAPVTLGFPVETCLQSDFLATHLHPDDHDRVLSRMQATGVNLNDIEMRLSDGDNRYLWIRAIVGESPTSEGRDLAGVMIDITEQRQMEVELLQAQKLESVGRLASGIAHEINTPIQYTSDSVTFIREALGSIMMLLDRYRSLSVVTRADAATLLELRALEDDTDLEYLRDRIPKALERAVDGLSRVAGLVRSMKEFSHPDQKEKVHADINHILTTTLTIANNEYKYVADVVTHFAALPPIPCHVNELSQAFLNLIVNAGHAIADVVHHTDERGAITIETAHEGNWITVSITDTGGGIPANVQPHIFEPFFTTKEIGKGTGQGLAISRNIVITKHGGTLTYKTEIGQGTCFTMRLPLVPNPTAVVP